MSYLPTTAPRLSARFGIGAGIVIASASTLANTYMAAKRAADGFGGFSNLPVEGWLNVILSGAFATGCEVIGFVALAAALYYAVKHAWVDLAAALLVFVVAASINIRNTHDFVILQARTSAEASIKATTEYQRLEALAAPQDADNGAVAPQDAPATPGAIHAKIDGLIADREAAVADGRWKRVSLIEDRIASARDDLAASMSYADQQAAQAAAAGRATAMLKEVRLPEEAEDLARTLTGAVEVVKAVGLIAFLGALVSMTGEGATTQAPIPASAPAGLQTSQKGNSAPTPKRSPEQLMKHAASMRALRAKWKGLLRIAGAQPAR